MLDTRGVKHLTIKHGTAQFELLVGLRVVHKGLRESYRIPKGNRDRGRAGEMFLKSFSRTALRSESQD